jgi:hypothetical protein
MVLCFTAEAALCRDSTSHVSAAGTHYIFNSQGPFYGELYFDVDELKDSL